MENDMDFPKLPQKWDDWIITEKVGEGSYTRPQCDSQINSILSKQILNSGV